MRKNNNKKIKNFFLTNKFVRKVRNNLQQKIFPIILKSFLAILIFLIAIIIAVKIFRPEYVNKIYRKSSFYFSHYINFDNREFGKVIITGNKRVEEKEVMALIKEIKADLNLSDDSNYQPLIKKLAIEIKRKLPWVSSVVVTRNIPDNLLITITEYEPFAIWQKGGEKYITDKDGNLVSIDDLEEFKDLVILSGDGANHHARSLFNIFTTDPELSASIYSATWVGGRRWDVRLEDGLLIKLPESNISQAWQSLIKIYNLPGSTSGLKTIDLRIRDKVYLEYDDSSIKKLKTI